MRKIFLSMLCMFLLVNLCSCAEPETSSQSTAPTALQEIQTITQEAQAAYEGNDMVTATNKTNQLMKIAQEPLYTENERLIAKYVAIYINAGMKLNYLIKNDNAWVNADENLDSVNGFNIMYGGFFNDVINGRITHNETLQEMVGSLVDCTRPIIERYNQIGGK